MTAHGNGLVLRIKMSHRYLAHLPMFVEVTLANRAADGTAYLGLPDCNPWAPPFPVEGSAAADVPLLGRLRLLRGADSPSWANFVEDRAALDRPEFRSLSAESRRALAPYVVMHHAVHGPEPLSGFPPEQLTDLQQGPWASEAAVLQYELAWARQAADGAQLRSSIRAAWPGVAYRLDEIDRGAGLLTALRNRVGAGGRRAP